VSARSAFFHRLSVFRFYCPLTPSNVIDGENLQMILRIVRTGGQAAGLSAGVPREITSAAGPRATARAIPRGAHRGAATESNQTARLNTPWAVRAGLAPDGLQGPLAGCEECLDALARRAVAIAFAVWRCGRPAICSATAIASRACSRVGFIPPPPPCSLELSLGVPPTRQAFVSSRRCARAWNRG